MKQYPFYGILDTGYIEDDNLEPCCRSLILGGAGMIQFRANNKDAKEREALLNRLLPIFETRDVPLILNADWKLAKKYPDVGLHISQLSFVEEARDAIGKDRILGTSALSQVQIDAILNLSNDLDYFSIGPVFPSKTKPECPPVGVQIVQYAHSKSPSIPFYAVGGINRVNVHQVVEAGAPGVVIVSDILCDQNIKKAVNQTIDKIEEKITA